MRALIEINGRQYEVEEGRYVQIDHYNADENTELTLENVCMILAGEQSIVGAPYVDGATVKATVKRHSRGPKVLVYKMHRKKGYRRKKGHRQDFTELQIVELNFPNKDKIKVADAPQAEAKPAKKTTKAAAADQPKAEKKSAPKKAQAAEAPAEQTEGTSEE